jgi:hypothetical protein
MLSSMFPVVRGTSRRKARYYLIFLAALHSVGSVFSATALGGILALTSIALNDRNASTRPIFACLAIGVSVIYLPRVMGWWHYPPLLQSPQQVPRKWMIQYRGWRVALFYGLALGSGLYTSIVVPTYYLLILWPFLGAGTAWTLAMWSAYGFTRTLNAWWLACTAEPADPMQQANRVDRVICRCTPWMFRVNALVMLAAILLVIKGL